MKNNHLRAGTQKQYCTIDLRTWAEQYCPAWNCTVFFRLKVAFHQYRGTSLSHEMRCFHYSQMVRRLHLSFSVCTPSRWPLALVRYLLRQESGTYFPFCNIYILSGRFPGYSVTTLLSSWNLTRTTGRDTAAGDNKTQPSNAIALPVKQ